jgi:hypothetical protein
LKPMHSRTGLLKDSPIKNLTSCDLAATKEGGVVL